MLRRDHWSDMGEGRVNPSSQPDRFFPFFFTPSLIAFVKTISVRIWEHMAFDSPISRIAEIACREFLYNCQNIEGPQCTQGTPHDCVWRNLSAFRQFLQMQLHTMHMLWSLSMCAWENSRLFTRIELLRKQSNVDGINKTITVRSGYGRYPCKFLDPSVIYMYLRTLALLMIKTAWIKL